MVKRQFWIKKIEDAWKRRSIIWLAGVRRVGKTVLSQSIPDTEYFDCELPRVRRIMEDPQAFFDNVKNKKIVLDEIHRLKNPSELLKIAADHYPKIKIIATGSSTLGISTKFKDTLAGRKVELLLTPMIIHDLKDFKQTDLKHRLQFGGMPPFFLSEKMIEQDYQEWMDSFWAKDIQELFRLERRHSFQKFVELLTLQSSGIFEATNFAAPCEVSRGTILNYLKVLETTFIVHVIHPFHSQRTSEIIAAPKVYTFDTGFVCFYRGWHQLRSEDFGILWEHFVLNELCAQLQTRDILYWRDKRGHEIDFILRRKGGSPIAIECKWSVDNYIATNFIVFNKQYPKAEYYVVANDVDRTYSKSFNRISIKFTGLENLINLLTTSSDNKRNM